MTINLIDYLRKLSLEELIQIVEEGSQETVELDALIRKIASEIFACDVNKTNVMQFTYILTTASQILAYELKKRL